LTASFKRCAKCGHVKPAAAFSPRPERPIGLSASCKACKSAFRSKRYRERRVALNDAKHLWCINARGWAACRAKTRHIAFTLTIEDVVKMASSGQCSYCNKVMDFQVEKGSIAQRRRDSPTLDQILPGQGYTIANTTISCYRCNAIKQDASAAELLHLATEVQRLVMERGLAAVRRRRFVAPTNPDWLP